MFIHDDECKGMMVERERVQKGKVRKAAAKKHEDMRLKRLMEKTAPTPGLPTPFPVWLFL